MRPTPSAAVILSALVGNATLTQSISIAQEREPRTLVPSTIRIQSAPAIPARARLDRPRAAAKIASAPRLQKTEFIRRSVPGGEPALSRARERIDAVALAQRTHCGTEKGPVIIRTNKADAPKVLEALGFYGFAGKLLEPAPADYVIIDVGRGHERFWKNVFQDNIGTGFSQVLCTSVVASADRVFELAAIGAFVRKDLKYDPSQARAVAEILAEFSGRIRTQLELELPNVVVLPQPFKSVLTVRVRNLRGYVIPSRNYWEDVTIRLVMPINKEPPFHFYTWADGTFASGLGDRPPDATSFTTSIPREHLEALLEKLWNKITAASGR